MISSGPPQVFVPFGREHYARHPGNTQPPDFNCYFPNVSTNTDAGEDILDAIKDFSLNDDIRKDADDRQSGKEDWLLRSGPICEEELYFKNNTVIWSRGRWNTCKHIVMAFTIDQPVFQAFWCHFSLNDIRESLNVTNSLKNETLNGIGVVSASKLNILTTDGQEFIVPLPFQVNGVWPMKYGLLLERKLSTNTNTNTAYRDSLPVVFSLLHPLNEVTPVVQRSIVGKLGFLGDHNQHIVYVFEEPSIVITYDDTLKIHTVWKLRLTKQSEEFHTIHNYDQLSTLNQPASFTPGYISNQSKISSPLQRSCSPLRNTSSRINSPNLKSRSQSPLLTNLTHMATISRSQSPSAVGNNLLSLSRTPSPSVSRNVTKTPLAASYSVAFKDDDNGLRKPLASEICLESLWVEPKSTVGRENILSGKASKVFITSDVLRQKYFCFLVPNYLQLRCVKMDDGNDINSPLFGLVTNIPAKDAEGLQGSHLMVIIDNLGNFFIYSGLTKICKIRIPFAPYSMFASSGGPRHIFGTSNIKLPTVNIVTSSRPPSALDIPFDEEVHCLSPVTTDVNESELDFSSSYPEDSNICSSASNIVCIRDVVENRITIELSGGAMHRVVIPTVSTAEIVDKALCSISHVIPRDAVMHLYSKWYMTCHAAGSHDTTPVQYWNSFAMVLLGISGYNVNSLKLLFSLDPDSFITLESVAKRFKPSDCGSDEDWDYLLNSNFNHSSSLLTLNEPKLDAVSTNNEFIINSDAVLFTHLPAIHFAIHLLYEELKLCKLMLSLLPQVAKLLYRFAKDLRYIDYADYYWRDFPEIVRYDDYNSQLYEADLDKLFFPSYLVKEPPSIYVWLENALLNKPQDAFPYLPDVNNLIRIIVMLYGVLIQKDFTTEINWGRYLKPIVNHQGLKLATSKHIKLDLNFTQLSCSLCEVVVLSVNALGVTLSDLNIMPNAVVFPLYEAINKCRHNPPPDWPAKVYNLIGREDLAAQIECPTYSRLVNSNNYQKMPIVSENKKPVIPREDDDGMEHMTNDSRRLHFSQDMRLQEVQRLLQSSKPARISIVQRSEVSDHEFLEEQERHLYSICIRTMAVLVGRGMFTLRTSKPVLTETLPIPSLCLTGRVPPRNTSIDLSHIDVPANMNMWPSFHNGVAAGLRIAHNASDIDSTWIVYNKPRGNADIPIEHAGFLMAMGLNGHLKNLDPMNIFGYAVKGNEMTSVGLLLGIAAAKKKTMDLVTTKLLSIHVEALLPPSSTELDIPHIVQVAAVLGIGLVYQSTAHRHMAEVLLSEIGRPPGPEMENSSDCESYSVSAGLALGLIMLGKGTNVAGLSDLGMADLLYHYMVGGPKRPLTGFAKERYKSPSYQIKEGDAINVDVTSPGATLALGFMFFGTNDSTVAHWMTAPDTQHLLDFVRPDFLLLRTLSKGLIMWDSILPTTLWVESHVPKIISSTAVLRGNHDSYVDMETLSQAYCNIIAGACMALGLRFAGSANEEAYNTLIKYARTFIGLSGKTASEQAGRTTVETCINVVVLSLATVMAGTGDLDVLRLCRHLHARIGQAHCQVLYGSHMATHMAIGLLFLGGGRYTLNNSKEAVAALVCAFFPKFPTHSNDNRYHLQALRHLYVLAVEPRLIIPHDIENGQPCYNHISFKIKPSKWYEETAIVLKAPTLLPQLKLLSEVCVDDPRYWPVAFRFDKNWSVLNSRLEKNGTIFVKRRTGCLSYADDPNGFRSLLAQSLVKDKSGKWIAKATAIEALTSDKTVLNFVDRFLQTLPNYTKSEKMDHNILSHNVYECVTQEKLDVVLPLVSIMKIGVLKTVSSTEIWEVRLISSYLESSLGVGQSLINEESFVALCSRVDKIIEEWSEEHRDALARYLMGSKPNCLPNALVPFLIKHSIPSPQKFQKYLTGEKNNSIPALFFCLEELNMPASTVIKIHNYLI